MFSFERSKKFMKIVIVTLAFNNPEQVRRTLASVALQSIAPDRHIVVDGSSPDHSEEIHKYSARAGAEYFWREPRGVYPAMNEALNEISPDVFVWFVNSSDWLASPESIKTVKQHLNGSVDWVIGGLHRYRDKKMLFHQSLRNGEDFVTALSSGRIGFPHPSAIMSKAGIEQCGGFDESYQIAGDYALALKFAQAFGAPHMIPDVLAIHDPTGLTSRNKLLHLIEKSRARRKSGGTAQAEVFALGNIIRAAITPAPKITSDAILSDVLSGFCESDSQLPWPDRCLETLDSWGQ